MPECGLLALFLRFFPSITDIPAIIRQSKKQCNLVWLENLNLRGDYKTVILNYIAEKYPELVPLYQEIYQKKDRSFLASLNNEMRKFTAEEELLYVRNDDSMKRPFNELPTVVNYFFHEEIIPPAKKKQNLQNQ